MSHSIQAAESHASEVKTITYAPRTELPAVDLITFAKLDMRVGTVKEVKQNLKARIPSLLIKMNFGSAFADLKQSSAQLCDSYLPSAEATTQLAPDGRPKAQLQDQQITAVVNFPVRHVGVSSYFLTLGIVSLPGDPPSGTIVIKPSRSVPDGARVSLLDAPFQPTCPPRTAQTTYEESFAQLDIRVGTVVSSKDHAIDFGNELGTFVYAGSYPELHDGMQVLRVFNLKGKEQDDNILGVALENGDLVPLVLERPLPNGRHLM